jgi:hypothetical protein
LRRWLLRLSRRRSRHRRCGWRRRQRRPARGFPRRRRCASVRLRLRPHDHKRRIALPVAQASRQAGGDHRRRRRLVCRDARISRARRLHEHIEAKPQACGHGAVDAQMDAERCVQTIIISSPRESHPNSNANRNSAFRAPHASKCMHGRTHRRVVDVAVGRHEISGCDLLIEPATSVASTASRRRTSHGTDASDTAPTRSQSELRQFD